jgi:hypothetical protein
MSQLRVVANISKGSPLTGSAWVDLLFGGVTVIERAEITAPFKEGEEVEKNSIEFSVDHDPNNYSTLTVINRAETIGPIQIYEIDFYLNDERLRLTWQHAVKGKPLRFGGQPNVTITNPHVGDPKFGGWCYVPAVSPGMSITWGLSDLITVQSS